MSEKPTEEPNPYKSPQTVSERPSTDQMRRRRRKLIFLGIFLVPAAAGICGFTCCTVTFAGLITMEWLRIPPLGDPYGITQMGYGLIIGGLIGTAGAIFFLSKRWKTISRETNFPD